LRNLQNVEKLERLQSLFVSGNRIPEFWEVDRLSELPHLMEIALMNNPVSRKPNYRTAIIKRLPALIVLDGKEITPEERMRIEQSGGMMPGDTKAPPMIHFAQYPTVKVPVKLNAVNFDGVFNNIKAFSEAQASGQGGNVVVQGNP
jgi:Leucine-rich repeat